MEDKILNLMEKIYSEFVEFRSETATELKSLKKEVTKNSLILEQLNSNINTIAEVQQNHQDINTKEFKNMEVGIQGEIEVTQLAVKSIGEDLRGFEKSTESRLTKIEDDIEYISHKEQNNEKDLFFIKKNISLGR